MRKLHPDKATASPKKDGRSQPDLSASLLPGLFVVPRCKVLATDGVERSIQLIREAKALLRLRLVRRCIYLYVCVHMFCMHKYACFCRQYV